MRKKVAKLAPEGARFKASEGFGRSDAHPLRPDGVTH
jgi:hypothetical protein